MGEASIFFLITYLVKFDLYLQFSKTKYGVEVRSKIGLTFLDFLICKPLIQSFVNSILTQI